MCLLSRQETGPLQIVRPCPAMHTLHTLQFINTLHTYRAQMPHNTYLALVVQTASTPIPEDTTQALKVCTYHTLLALAL